MALPTHEDLEEHKVDHKNFEKYVVRTLDALGHDMTKVRSSQNELERHHGTIQRNQHAIGRKIPGFFLYALIGVTAAASVGSCYYSKLSYEALERMASPAVEAEYDINADAEPDTGSSY